MYGSPGHFASCNGTVRPVNSALQLRSKITIALIRQSTETEQRRVEYALSRVRVICLQKVVLTQLVLTHNISQPFCKNNQIKRMVF
jgi:hypothetical protein